MLVAIVMAGGSGERFWPLSTPEKPKQLLKIFSKKSMIRETVDRILPIIDPDKIFITTNEIQEKAIKKELGDIPEENIIIEPMFKDTAAAIGYASLIIEKKFKNILKNEEKIKIVVLASDHLIKNENQFIKSILKGAEEAKNNNVIVTLGVKPIKPETGYGYIELKETQQIKFNEVYKVKKFREKPNLETAELYIESGNYLWNSGIFIFTIDTIFKNFEVLMEDHMEIFNCIKNKLTKNMNGLFLMNFMKEEFKKFEKISIDFGLMEHSKNIRVVPVDIGWNDIGSYKALEEIFPKNIDGNIIINTKVSNIESSDNIIIGDGETIYMLGIKNLIIAKNGKNILIANKNNINDIKKIIRNENIINEKKE